MKSQVLLTVWCNISGGAVGEIWNWSFLGETGLTLHSAKDELFTVYGYWVYFEYLVSCGGIIWTFHSSVPQVQHKQITDEMQSQYEIEVCVFLFLMYNSCFWRTVQYMYEVSLLISWVPEPSVISIQVQSLRKERDTLVQKLQQEGPTDANRVRNLQRDNTQVQ